MSAFRGQLRGIILVVLSSTCFAAVDGISKALSQTQSVGQIVWGRYALALPVLMLATGPRVWKRLFRTSRPGLQILRGMSPLALSAAMVLAVRYLPLAEATVILFTAPFLVVALSGTLLGEHVRITSWVAVALGFAAVVLVARPGLGGLSIYVAFPLVAALFYALLQITTRHLGASGESAETTLAWTLAIGSLVATPIAILTWAPTGPADWALLAALGTSFGVGQLLVIHAFTLAPANVLAPFGYAQIVAAVLIGVVVFGTIPDPWTFVGVALIVFAGVLVVRSRSTA